MRLIHTSDWHLGQTLHGFDRRYEHQCFLDWLLDTLVAEQADALLVAGDVFDSANPPASAQQQLYAFLTAARARVPHLHVVLVAGNHDSPARMEAPRPFLGLFDGVVVGQMHRLPDGTVDTSPAVVPLRDRQGQVAAWCLAVPFLRPADVPRQGSREDSEDGNPFVAGVAALYADALAQALTLRQAGQAVVAMGHCHMQGGKASEDSERRIVVGGSEAIPAHVFGEEIAYAALGHLHLAQAVGGQAHIRYSGSPLPLSFAETAYPHQVVCVELQDGAAVAVKPIRVPRFVDLLRIPAQPAPLVEVLPLLAALDLPALPDQQQPYLEVQIRLDAPEPGLRVRIESALVGKPVRLAKIGVSQPRQTGSDLAVPLSLDELDSLRVEDIFSELFRRKYGREADASLLEALQSLQAEGALEGVRT